MKKLLLILLCVPLIFSCGENTEENNTENTEKKEENDDNVVVIVKKKISILSSINKDKIYFTQEELRDFEDQDFVQEIAKFNKATNFKIFLSSDMLNFGSNLFFESIPDKYLDIESDKWKWEEDSDFIPIMMPEDYLHLYNLGFAEPQGLPLLSQKMISSAKFNVRLLGENKRQVFRGGIVGFSAKINSILVPEDFLNWANEEFGSREKNNPSRILVEFNNPNDEKIIEFLNENNYEVTKIMVENPYKRTK